MNFRKWSAFLFPNHFSMGVMLVGLGIFLLTVMTSLCVGVIDAAHFVSKSISVLCCSAPLIVLAFGVGSLMERHAAPRAILSACSILAIVYGFIVLIPYVIANPTKDSDPVSVLFGLGCLTLPVLLLASLPMLIALRRVSGEYKAYVEGQRTTELKEYLASHNGILLYPQAEKVLGWNEKQIDQTVRQCIDSGVWSGERNAEAKCFLTQQAVLDCQKRMVEMTRSRGEMTMEAMGRELGVPERMVRNSLMWMIQTEHFPGYVDWDTGVVYPPDISSIQAGQRCPKCGGELILAGKDVVQCRNCGAHIFGRHPLTSP